MSTHVGDCGGFSLSIEDGAWYRGATNDLPKTETRSGPADRVRYILRS